MSAFSIEKTQVLLELFAIPADRRDPEWYQRMYSNVPDAALVAVDPQIGKGPDTFSYLQLALPGQGSFTPFSVNYALDFVLDHGLGIAIFGVGGNSANTQWVFTFGDLLSFKMFGDFGGGRTEPPGPSAAAGQLLVASPNDEYLPACARKALGTFVHDVYRHPSPKIALVMYPSGERQLMINLSLDQYDGDEGKLRAAVRYLGWYLPRTYSIVPMPDGWTDESFLPLL